MNSKPMSDEREEFEVTFEVHAVINHQDYVQQVAIELADTECVTAVIYVPQSPAGEGVEGEFDPWWNTEYPQMAATLEDKNIEDLDEDNYFSLLACQGEFSRRKENDRKVWNAARKGIK